MSGVSISFIDDFSTALQQHNTTTTTSTSADPTASDDAPATFTLSDTAKGVIYAVVLLVGILLCIRPNTSSSEEMLRAAQLRAQAVEAYRRRQTRQEKLGNPNWRQEAMDQALLVQQIQSVDPRTGHMTLGDVDPEKGEQNNNNNNNNITRGEVPDNNLEQHEEEKEEDSTCAICLEPFQVGEIVAMSRQMAENPFNSSACRHVFHRECISAWLHDAEHVDCPSCRKILLILDDDDEEEEKEAVVGVTTAETEEEEEDLPLELQSSSNSNSSMAFVIINGLVARARQASFSWMSHSAPLALTHTASFATTGHGDDECDEDPLAATPTPIAPPPILLQKMPSVTSGEGILVGKNTSTLRRRSFGWRSRNNSIKNVMDHTEMRMEEEQEDESVFFLSRGDPLRRVVSVGPGSSPSRQHASASSNLHQNRRPLWRSHLPPQQHGAADIQQHHHHHDGGHSESVFLRRSVTYNHRTVLPDVTDISENVDDDEDDILVSSPSS